VIAGAAIGAAGGTTIAGAEIGYYAVSNGKLKDAQKACESDRELMMECKELQEKFFQSEARMRGVSVSYIRGAWNAIAKRASEGRLVTSIPRASYCSYKGIDAAFEVGRTTSSAIAAGSRAGTAVARTAWAGASTLARVVSVVGVVFDVALIPIDIGVMIKASYDVHQYRTTGESNSNVAKDIGNLIRDLELNKDAIQDFCDQL